MFYDLVMANSSGDGPVITVLALIVVFGLSVFAFYQAWWRLDDMIESMLSPFEDPEDLNRWLVKSDVYKWFVRFIATAMLLAYLYAVIGRRIVGE
jgi:hypothetical protein